MQSIYSSSKESAVSPKYNCRGQYIQNMVEHDCSILRIFSLQMEMKSLNRCRDISCSEFVTVNFNIWKIVLPRCHLFISWFVSYCTFFHDFRSRIGTKKD